MPSDTALEPIIKKVVTGIVEEHLQPVKADQAAMRKDLDRMGGLLIRLSEDQLRLETRLLTAFRNLESTIQMIVDPLLKRLDTERGESVIHRGQHERLEQMEERVEKLEGSRPKGQHTAS